MTSFFSPCVRRHACPCSHPYISSSFYCSSQPVIGRKTFPHHAAWFNVCASLFPSSLGGGLTKYITTTLTEKKEIDCQVRVEVEFYYMVLSSLAIPLRLQRENMLSVTEAILKNVSQLDQPNTRTAVVWAAHGIKTSMRSSPGKQFLVSQLFSPNS